MHILGLMILCWFFLLCALSSPLLMSCFLVVMSVAIGLLIGVWTGIWQAYIMGLVFTGGMMVMVLYVTNLAVSEKSKYSDVLCMLGSASFLMYVPCTMSPPWARNISTAAMAPLLTEVLLFALSFLLLGLFMIVSAVDKKMGSLR